MVLSVAACNSLILLKAIISVIILFVIMTIILWLEKLRKSKDCECSKDWKRTYILGFLSFLFVWNATFGSYTIYRSYVNKCSNGIGVFSSGLVVPATLLLVGMVAYIVVSYLYAKHLQDSACACAMKDKGYNFMRIYTVFITTLLLMPFLLPILLVLIAAIWLIIRKVISKKK